MARPELAGEHKLVLQCEHPSVHTRLSACAGAVNKPWAASNVYSRKSPLLPVYLPQILESGKIHTQGKKIHKCVTFTHPSNTPSLKNKITRLKKKQ